jgi:hypothetical protein
MAVAEGETRMIVALPVHDAVIVKVAVLNTHAEGPLQPISPRAE